MTGGSTRNTAVRGSRLRLFSHRHPRRAAGQSSSSSMSCSIGSSATTAGAGAGVGAPVEELARGKLGGKGTDVAPPNTWLGAARPENRKIRNNRNACPLGTRSSCQALHWTTARPANSHSIGHAADRKRTPSSTVVKKSPARRRAQMQSFATRPATRCRSLPDSFRACARSCTRSCASS